MARNKPRGNSDGTLLGWTVLQRSLDSLGHRIEKLTTKLGQGGTNQGGRLSSLFSSPASNNASGMATNRTTAAPTFSGQAGGASGAVRTATTVAGVSSVASAVSQYAGGGGNGGHAAAGGGGRYAAGVATGTAVYSVAKFGGKALGALASYGDAKMTNMVTMELAAAQAAQYQSGSAAAGQKTFLDQTFGSSAARPSNTNAMNSEDAINTALARIRTSGGLSAKGSIRDVASDRAWRSMSMPVANASHTSTDAAVAAGEIQGTASQKSFYKTFGKDTYDPKTHSYIGNAEIARKMFLVATGTETPDQARLAASMQENGKFRYNMNQLSWSAQTKEMFTGYASQLADLQQRGMDYRQADTLMSQASNKDDPGYAEARKKLKSAGWNETQFQTLKDTEALERSGDRAVFDDYIKNLKASSKAVEEWTTFVKTFLDLPPVKAVLGMGGALSKMKDNPGAILPWLAGTGNTVPWGVPKGFTPTINQPATRGIGDLGAGLIGPGGINSGGNITHLPQGGSAAPTPGDKDKKAAKGTGSEKRSQPSAAGGAAGALAFAMAQRGKPYVWGATGPNAYDCSGLTMKAYESVGKNISRTTYTQINKGNPVSRDPDSWLPGDLIFPHAGHVVMWAGNNSYVHAPNKSRPVSVDRGKPRTVLAVRRMMGGGGKWKNASGADPKAMDSPSGSKKSNGTPDPNNPQDVSGTSPSGDSSILGQASGAFGASEREVLTGIFASGGDSAGWVQGGAAVGDTGPGDIDASAGKTAKGADKKAKGKKTTKPSRGNGGSPSANEALGKQMAAARGWGGKEWPPLDKLWTKESGWRSDAENPSSGAYGIPQANPSGGHPIAKTDRYRSSPAVQIDWGLDYIKGRYGKPSSAWAHSQRTGWYREGQWNVQQDEVATVHQGEMIVPANEAGRIRDVLMRKDSTSGGGGGVAWTFGPGSIVLHLGSGGSGGASPANARSHAKALFAELENITRNQKIARGM